MKNVQSKEGACGQISRRDMLKLLGGLVGATGLNGCCSLKPFASPSIPGEPPEAAGMILQPRVIKDPGTPKFSVDVHAHFFNASDVPVKGYLEGPVAHDLKEPLRSLVMALAPFADQLASIAPTASEEYAELLGLAERPSIKAVTNPSAVLDDLVRRRQSEISSQFYDVVKESPFEQQYNAITAEQRKRKGVLFRSELLQQLNKDSLGQALRQGSRPDKHRTLTLRQEVLDEAYPEGILAFVGYMLSHRWMNLHEYSQAYSATPDAFGVDHVFGALVDFDRWLDCPPRSSHDDQVKLHQLLSKLSGGYMQPLVAYNPWTDIVTHGKATEQVVDAIKKRGFVGVKIYPPNGFRPYGNTETPLLDMPGAPTAADLDVVLAKFWDKCVEQNIPVMAHTGATMGSDNAHDKLGGPQGWGALYRHYSGRVSPTVNAGHFGGDEPGNNWTNQIAELMAQPEGSTLYGDLGYWSRLRCENPEGDTCRNVRQRLQMAVAKPGVAKRVMYGSDWLMLSRERDWAMYPHDIALASKGILAADDLFGLNAQRCFGSRLTV